MIPMMVGEEYRETLYEASLKCLKYLEGVILWKFL